MTILNVLEDARALIEGGWCRGEYDREIKGKMHFCVVGAFQELQRPPKRYAFGVTAAAQDELWRQLKLETGDHPSLVEWNDKQKSKRPILRLFDRTIARVKAERDAQEAA